MPPPDDGLDERGATRWPDLPMVQLTPRPPEPAGPARPDPRWELLYELAHPDPLVRLEAAERSGPHAKDPLIRDVLLERFHDPDPQVAAQAMVTLGAGDDEVRDRLFVVMRDRRGMPKRVAASLLIDSGELRGRWYGFARSVLELRSPRVIHLY